VIFAIVIIDAILILGLLWISTGSLYQQKQDIASAFGIRRLSMWIRVLMVAPPLIFLIVAILLAFQNEFLVNFIHAFFLLGLWIAAILLVFSYLLFARLKHTLQFAAVLGFLCAMIPVLYFTPIYNFQGLFGQVGPLGYALPFIEAAAIIGISYYILLRLNRTLH